MADIALWPPKLQVEGMFIFNDMLENGGLGGMGGGNPEVIRAVEGVCHDAGLSLHLGTWGKPPGLGNATVFLNTKWQ